MQEKVAYLSPSGLWTTTMGPWFYLHREPQGQTSPASSSEGAKPLGVCYSPQQVEATRPPLIVANTKLSFDLVFMSACGLQDFSQA